LDQYVTRVSIFEVEHWNTSLKEREFRRMTWAASWYFKAYNSGHLAAFLEATKLRWSVQDYVGAFDMITTLQKYATVELQDSRWPWVLPESLRLLREWSESAEGKAAKRWVDEEKSKDEEKANRGQGRMKSSSGLTTPTENKYGWRQRTDK